MTEQAFIIAIIAVAVFLIVAFLIGIPRKGG